MALFKGTIIGAASGKLAGNVFSHNSSGQYIRQFAVPVNPMSTNQQRARMDFSNAAIRWRETLTQGQRDAWEAIAPTITAVNRLGDAIQLTGQQAFVRAASIAALIGQPSPDDAPADTGNTDSGLLTLNALEFETAANETRITIDVGDSPAWAASDDGIIIAQLGQGRATSHTFYGTPYRFFDTETGDALAPVTQSIFAKTFGTTAGLRYWVRLRAYLEGRLSQVVTVNGIMAAV